ncbi:ATP-binding cassette domain-containing protein [Cohnella laeviribosi]|uniref:ATP-binding cassette domain-containing protein n=1 Tax=Cohnella laeviribosi TaxID=380174 RepID=UPI000382841B|nr:ATP-binding cassette domain-containing protein [Cohnella laeviribosi]
MSKSVHERWDLSVTENGRRWQFKPGTITVVFGPSGAGKTFWLEQLAGLRFSEGVGVAYGPSDLWTADLRLRPRQNPAALMAYAYASQAPEEQLAARTVAAELEYALRPYGLAKEERLRRQTEALAAVGWDSAWLERDPFRMSGGERRRLALACLLAVPARWLLLDEPTAGLDAEGHALLAERLIHAAREGRGVVVVSHDTEWALPLADQVLLIASSGAKRLCGRDELLACPELWAEAGMEVPEWLRLAGDWLKEGATPEAVWDVSALAKELASPEEDDPLRFSPESSAPNGESARLTPIEAGSMPYGPFLPTAERGTLRADAGLSAHEQSAIGRAVSEAGVFKRPASAPEPDGLRQSRLAGYDPRAVWLAYIVMSAAIFTVRDWTGLGIGAAIVLFTIVWARIPLRRWRGAIIAFCVFSVAVSLAAGTGAGGSSLLNAEATLTALHSMGRTLLVMLIGLGMTLVITPLRLRKSLEQLLARRGCVGRRAQNFILTVTLLMRFIPVLLGEWERFERLAVARGKTGRMTARNAIARLKDTAIPFLLALFRLGDQAALALESRGVGRRPYPEVRPALRWSRRDSLLLAAACLCAALLVWWALKGAAYGPG